MEKQQTQMQNGRSALTGSYRILLAALFLICALPSLHADWVSDSIASTGFCANISWTQDFNSPIATGILLLIVLFALAYMASQIFEKPELSVWAKSEGLTLVWSVLLIGLVMGGFMFSCGLSNVLAGNGGAPANPLSTASGYIGGLTDNFGLPLATQLAQTSIADQLNSVYYAYWTLPILNGGGIAYKANQRAWSSQADLLVDLYLPLLISLNVQKLMLDVLSVGVVGVLLPAALLLRLFFFTRDTGNLLIALSFALFFCLPLVYVFCYQSLYAGPNAATAGGTASQGLIASMGGTNTNPFASFDAVQDSIVGDAYGRIGFMAVAAILFPNLALVVVVTMTMAINKALKGFVP